MTRRTPPAALPRDYHPGEMDAHDNESTPVRIAGSLPPAMRRAVAPLVPWAFGCGMGVLFAVVLVALAGFHAITEDSGAGKNSILVWLLGRNFLIGYGPTPLGVVMGAVWGFPLGFLFGWLAAVARNGLVALSVILTASRERARAARTLLDDLN